MKGILNRKCSENFLPQISRIYSDSRGLYKRVNFSIFLFDAETRNLTTN